MLQGHLENIQEDGLITGWCWDPEQPAERANLIVLVDNEPVGDLIADNFRPDLEAAGVGDGAHAFTFLLPWSAIARKSVTSVHIADPVSNRAIGGTLTFRRTALLPVEQRLTELEHSARLLQARLDEANRHASRMVAMVQSTLATIGTFFTQLAEMPLDVLPRQASTGIINRLLANARPEFEPFAFSVPASPLMTICISGAGGLAEVYSCLRTIKACGIDDEAEIIVIDSGFSEDGALVPLLVQNIRYWRVGANQSLLEARNRLANLGSRELLLFLSPSVRMRPDWLAAVQATFAAHPNCAVLGSTVLRSDGTVQSSALTLHRSGRLSDRGYAETPEAPWLNRLQPVAAIPDHAMLIRQAVFAEVEGFDPAYVDLAAAATDLCLRCWDSGYSVLHQPVGTLHWEDGGIVTSNTAAADPGLDMLLAERWQHLARPAWPASKGRALIIDTGPAMSGNMLLQNAEALQQLGYDVAFGNIMELGSDDPGSDALRKMGIEVLRAPYDPSVLGAIKNASPGFDIIQISPAAAAYVSPETIRPLSPGSRIILAMDEPACGSLANMAEEQAARLSAALTAADGVIAPNESARSTILGNTKKSVAVLMPSEATARDGLWLLLDGPEEAVLDAGRWLRTLLAALTKAVPSCTVHTLERAGLHLPAGIKQHAAGEELLGRMRLALAPFRLPALEPAAIKACAQAGLPLIVTTAALNGASPSPGMVEVDAKAQAIGRLLRKLESKADWDDLAAPLRVRPATKHWVNAYRALAKNLKLTVL